MFSPICRRQGVKPTTFASGNVWIAIEKFARLVSLYPRFQPDSISRGDLLAALSRQTNYFVLAAKGWRWVATEAESRLCVAGKLKIIIPKTIKQTRSSGLQACAIAIAWRASQSVHSSCRCSVIGPNATLISCSQSPRTHSSVNTSNKKAVLTYHTQSRIQDIITHRLVHIGSGCTMPNFTGALAHTVKVHTEMCTLDSSQSFAHESSSAPPSLFWWKNR